MGADALRGERPFFVWITLNTQDTICLWEILELMWPDNRKFGSSCLVPKDLPTWKLQFMTSVTAIQFLEGKKKSNSLIYIENSNLRIIKVRPSWAGKGLVPHGESTFQTYGTISVTKKAVTWAGCNFPAELVWEFSCVRACVCARKKKGEAGSGRNLPHYALMCIFSVCRQSTSQNFLSWGPRFRH